MSNDSHRKSNNFWIGLALIILGVIFLSDTFHIIRFGRLISRWWPVILIIIGVTKLSGKDSKGGWTLIIVGILLQLTTLHIVSWHFIGRLWPVILIIIGIGILLKRSSSESCCGKDFTESSEDMLEFDAIFSGTEKQITSQKFHGGEISAIFGSIKLDLRNAGIAPEGCNLTADAIFGSIEIYVSPDVTVNLRGSQILGRFDNHTNNVEGGPAITIKGDAIFGSVRISN
ncbi:MAG: cell wall-active antibiotics response protein [Candidatus Marinimicrobia bacterium]|nr:cell wall-active antibiotics response protein [Candidatus Neomarinimicrobiota bacterium]